MNGDDQGLSAAPAPDDSQFSGLTQSRAGFAQELSNPDLRRKFMALIDAEVGDQSPQAQQAFIESAMNRGAARGKTLDQIISDRGYYPNGGQPVSKA
jgi:hypothetical protein